jgi:hypothetical protein
MCVEPAPAPAFFGGRVSFCIVVTNFLGKKWNFKKSVNLKKI